MGHDAHNHGHAHDRGHGHGHGHGQPDLGDLAELLDLDAEILGTSLDEITEWVAGHTAAAVGTIVDLGAGTGTGTVALGRRFPVAELIAVDRWPTMLEKVGAAAESAGRDVRLVEADLDRGWPDGVTGVDVAWASSSLHEVADPDRLLGDVHTALAQEGLLAVVEMDAFPRFLPDSVGAGVERRCHEMLTASGWNSYPDWTGHLERAGFEVADRREFVVERTATPTVRRYARMTIDRMRRALADRLSADDLRILDALVAEDGPESLATRDDLVMRGRRIGWAAR